MAGAADRVGRQRPAGRGCGLSRARGPPGPGIRSMSETHLFQHPALGAPREADVGPRAHFDQRA
eukprot:7896607-Alexandrium_andersonii.AAC.1